MTSNSLSKAALLMVLLVVAAVVSWEFYLRNKGVGITYDDGGPLWSDKRAMVYEPADQSTVFIGSSRIKFDLDLETWKNITGDHPVMLAIVGSSPVPLLHDLADDEKFKGRLVIDVTEPLFFSNAPFVLSHPNENIKYYRERTPAQKAGFVFNRFMESKFVFLDKEFFSLNAILGKVNVSNRPGVYVFPPYPGFPMDFGRTSFDRQDKMTDKFIADTNLQNQVKDIWNFVRTSNIGPPPTDEAIEAVIQTVKTATDKIKARGGQIMFVRTPSSGPMGMGEKMGFPREKYWNRLLEVTGSPGIHFADYPALDHFICPEWSHLAPKDGIVFTRELVKILNEEKGWKFPKLTGSLTFNN
jgi:hypothetical protein